MAIFKCKMCGGALDVQDGMTVIECDYCGTNQTLPKLDDERKANLYDRANHFRRSNEFDKAIGMYEQILNEDNTDSEAYWSLVLCRYGIEYVEDPMTHKRVPTVNRAQYTSIFADEDYKSALQYADAYQKNIYEAEAAAIDEIQKGILAVSQREEPFDIFICYKETDNNGRRTPDSVLATDLYHQLVQEGFKVFFARITLEDKIGTAYEPYIFAALNSAKVMVVLGTKPDYFNAVWVKNEWSRFLALIKKGERKILIPAYRDMDPYDLPEAFSHLQAQDMSKLGFMQDLIRGIKKIAGKEERVSHAERDTVVVNNANINVESLLKRAFMFLEDADWATADKYCEKILDQEPENAQAYLCKLMVQLKVPSIEKLKDTPNQFDDTSLYNKVMRFADENLKAELTSVNEFIKNRNEQQGFTDAYSRAMNLMQTGTSDQEFLEAAKIFERIKMYKDSASYIDRCYIRADEICKDNIYNAAVKAMNTNLVPGCEKAIKLFNQISDWKDSKNQMNLCMMKIDSINAEKERALARLAEDKYNLAVNYANSRSEDYIKQAINIFKSIINYKDSRELIQICEDNLRTLQIMKSMEANQQEKKNGCYVATCVYGSYDCPQVWTLRRFRDDTLASTWYGRAFIRTYYAISPTLVKWFGGTEWFKKMWKGTLDRMVSRLQNNGVESTPYKDKEYK